LKVKVSNFQSIKEAEVEIKGLTVVIGENSIGKSALARAISGVFSNTRGDSHVRNGEKYSSVHISFEDGNEVLWEKGKNVNRYDVNGVQIPKAGSGVPSEVEALGVRSIVVDGRELFPQVARQFETIFLLDLPPSVLSSALSDVDRIQALEQASSNARSDIRNISSRLKVKREDLESAFNRNKIFEGFDENAITQAKTLKKEMDALEADVVKAEKFSEARNKLSRTKQTLQKIEGLSLPVYTEGNINIETLEKAHKKRVRALLYEGILGVGLEELEIPDIPSLSDISELEGLLKRRNKMLSAIAILSDIEDMMSIIDLSLDMELIPLCEKRAKIAMALPLVDSELIKLKQELDEITSEIQKGQCPVCLREGEHDC
jgi:hypothetical protein